MNNEYKNMFMLIYKGHAILTYVLEYKLTYTLC